MRCGVEAWNRFLDLILAVHFIASGTIFSIIWRYYVDRFAHAGVKDHILTVIHGCFINLPWDKFWPTVYDLEVMNKVCDNNVQNCMRKIILRY